MSHLAVSLDVPYLWPAAADRIKLQEDLRLMTSLIIDYL